jgi:hypothetical protein
MKTRLSVIAVVLLETLYVPAQTTGPTETALDNGGYFVAERGPHTRTWARVSWMTNAVAVRAFTNTYTELQTGISFRDPNSGQWKDSSPAFKVRADGYLVADQGQHQLVVAPDAATPNSRTGRFTSRDPRNGVFRRAETLLPYAYAVNNPQVFTDPTGEFTLIELIITTAKQSGLQGFRTVAIAKARQKALRTLGGIVKDEVVKQVQHLFPVPEQPSSWKKGIEFTQIIRDYICEHLHAPDQLFLEIPMTVEGTPLRNGFTCNQSVDEKELLDLVKLSVPRPDFVIGQRPPKAAGGYNKTWIVGELKSNLAGLYREYVKPANNLDQFSAIVNYSTKHTYSHISLFIAATKGRGAPAKAVLETELARSALRAQSLPIVIEILE